MGAACIVSSHLLHSGSSHLLPPSPLGIAAIDDYFAENQLSEIEDLEDLKSYVSEISGLRNTFRECIEAFKLILGDNEKFYKNYSECNDLLDQVSKSIKDANSHIRLYRKKFREMDIAEEKELRERQMLRRRSSEIRRSLRN